MRKEPKSAFISYTRQGGADYAERVRELLTSHGITVWQDRTHMRGGEDYWRQIEEAIERCSYLIMVVTPDALEGERRVLRQEWYTARKMGTCVVPVKGSPQMAVTDGELPPWLTSRHVYDIDNATEAGA